MPTERAEKLSSLELYLSLKWWGIVRKYRKINFIRAFPLIGQKENKGPEKNLFFSLSFNFCSKQKVLNVIN